MTLEEELIGFLRDIERAPGKVRKDGAPRKPRKKDPEIDERNLSLILDHFMFGAQSSFWPTLDELGLKYGIGTRERVRQIIDASYVSLISGIQLPSCLAAAALLDTRRIWSERDYLEALREQGLIGEMSSAIGLLNYLNSQSLGQQYSVHLPDMSPATRSVYFDYDDRLIVHNDDLAQVRAEFAVAKGIPGKCGLAEVSYVLQDMPDANLENIKTIIRANSYVWRQERDGEFWYSFDNKENVLLYNSTKLFAVVDSYPLEACAEVLANSLTSRAREYPYPPSSMIEEWLGQSMHFNVVGGLVTPNSEPAVLNPIEVSVVEIMAGKEPVGSDILSKILKDKGYSAASIQKALFSSPIVRVDKSAGRTRYRFSLVSHTAVAAAPVEIYDRLKARLRALGRTDNETIALARREQSILAEWVFGNDTHANCAICQKRFSVRAMVTAHKKRRASCTEQERLDPNVVFPLCVFGCDYLYEHGLVVIRDGVVSIGAEPESDTEREAVTGLLGKRLADRWSAGPSSYFDYPRRI